MYGNGPQNPDDVQYSTEADDPRRVTGIVTSSNNNYHRMAPVVKVPQEEVTTASTHQTLIDGRYRSDIIFCIDI